MKRKSVQSGQRRRHLTSQEKEEIFRAHKSSGLSLLSFVRREGLCYSSLRRWKRQLGIGTPGSVRGAGTSESPTFIPVEMESDAPSGDYVLTWPGGVALRIPRRFEVDGLRRLLAVLEVLK